MGLHVLLRPCAVLRNPDAFVTRLPYFPSTPASTVSSIVVNLRTLILIVLRSTLDESNPPNSLLCTLCMQDRGHISKCSDAQSNKDRHTHSCSGSWMNKPMMQRTNSRTLFCLVPPQPLALPLLPSSIWKRKKNETRCASGAPSSPVTSGMKEWVKAVWRRRGGGETKFPSHRHPGVWIAASTPFHPPC